MAIDQSTSSTKAIAFDVAGRKLDSSSQAHAQLSPQPGWFEHDAEEIWINVQRVFHDVYQRQRDLGPPAFLSLTNQRETIVVFDRESGKPLYNALVWQCGRGTVICDRLTADNFSDVVAEKTGLKIDTYFSASKLTWLVKNVTNLAEKLARGEALIGTIDTYLLYRLTGGQVYATDFTNASRTLLYNVNCLSWDQQLCDIFQLPKLMLPEVRESSAEFGRTTVGKSLAEPIAIYGVMGDSQAALFAQHCFQPGSVKATLGTGTSIMMNVGHKFVAPAHGAVTALAWVYKGQPTYAIEGLINYSAATIAWLKDQLQLIHSFDEAETLARSVPDTMGVYLVPAFAGLGAPFWQSGARAAIVGMTAQTSRPHIVRAALESIAYQMRDVLGIMQKLAGVTTTALGADGGGIVNRFLMQFIADICNVDVRASDVAELSAKGAIEMGWLGSGTIRSLDDLSSMAYQNADQSSPDAVDVKLASCVAYKPQMDRDLADSLYSGWQAAVQRVL